MRGATPKVLVIESEPQSDQWISEKDASSGNTDGVE